MEPAEYRQRLTELFRQHRYTLLILLAGILLLVLPSGRDPEEQTEPAQPEIIVEESFEIRLAGLLSQMEGAGTVRIFLSQAAGEQTLFQTDTDTSQNSVRQETVVITEQDRSQNGLIRQINPPQYRGAVVLCQGADDPGIRLAITQAVARATGLGTDQISVLKMK